MRVLVVPALLAGVLAAVPPAHAGCATVRARGAWTLADSPVFEDVTAATVKADSDLLTHLVGYPAPRTVPLGRPARYALTNGVRTVRTTDDGCTWRPVNVMDTADPDSVVVHTDPQYCIVATASHLPGAKPVAGRDVAYVLWANHDGLAGVGQNLAGQPYYVGRSIDGGATWQTDLLQVTLPGAPKPTPVLGNATTTATMLVAPSDPRVAYLLLDIRDPRSVHASTEKVLDGGLYVTRDLGVTWSYAMPFDPLMRIVVDPADSSVVYAVGRGQVTRTTVGATPKTQRLFDFPVDDLVSGFDVTHPAPGPVRLLVSTSHYDKGQRIRLLRHSADGGRTWRELTVSLPFSGTFDSALVGEQAWLTASGDVVAFGTVGGGGVKATLLLRWDGRLRAWRKAVTQSLPLKAGWHDGGLDVAQPVDAGHRWFAVGGYVTDRQVYARVTGVWDSAR